MVENPGNDLFAPLFPGTEHTLLREIMLLVVHTSSHIGQIVKSGCCSAIRCMITGRKSLDASP